MRQYRRVRGTEAEAAAALALLATEVTGGADTCDALVGDYLAHLESEQRSPATVRRYRQLWRDWLAPSLAGLRPEDLRRPQLERALAAMAKAGQSPSSIHQAAVLLSGCVARAWRADELERNPALGLRLPNGTTLAPPRRR